MNPVSNTDYGCNCRSKENCPLQNECLTPKMVYQADVKNLANDGKKFYLGVTEIPFKERFGNHMRDFKHPKYRNSTELSKYVWELKDAHISPVIEWSIVAKGLSKTQLNLRTSTSALGSSFNKRFLVIWIYRYIYILHTLYTDIYIIYIEHNLNVLFLFSYLVVLFYYISKF